MMIQDSAKDQRLLDELRITVMVRCLDGCALTGVKGIPQVSAQVRPLRNTDRSHQLLVVQRPICIDWGFVSDAGFDRGVFQLLWAWLCVQVGQRHPPHDIQHHGAGARCLDLKPSQNPDSELVQTRIRTCSNTR
jgi:hypothetical protein